MANGRTALRELLFLIAFTGLSGPIVYPLFGAVGAIGWAVLSEWLVWYDNQYDWFAGCLAAGHYFGLVGILACAAWWVRFRWAHKFSAPRLPSTGVRPDASYESTGVKPD